MAFIISFLSNFVSKSKFTKNLVILLSGTGLAQVMGILLSPVLSRVYTPKDFGIFGTVLALSGILISISTLRYENALVLEKDEEEVIKLQDLCVLILLIVSFLSCFFILFFPQVFFWIDRDANNSQYLIYAIPIIFFTGLYNIFYFRLNREEEYKVLAKVQVYKKLALLFFQLLFGVLGFFTLGLIMGNILGSLIATVIILISFTKKIKLPNFRALTQIAKRYHQFPLYSAPQGLINSIMAQLPVIVLSAKYGVVIVGAYYFALKIVQLPATFMGQAVRTVFYKEAVNRKDQFRNLYQLLNKVTLTLFLLMISPVILLVFFGPSLFSYIFGTEWELAGEFAKWLILWFGMNFIHSPSRSLFFVFEKQRLLLISDFALSIVRSIVLLITMLYFDATWMIALYSIVSVIFMLITIIGWQIFIKRQIQL